MTSTVNLIEDKPRIFDELLESKSFVEERISHEFSYKVYVSKESVRCCIGMVDMIDSTRIAASMGMEKMSTYYKIFLNHTAEIISEFGGTVIKNIGDCLLFCFIESKDMSEIKKCLKCALALSERHDVLCRKLAKEKLPCVDYRISLDYGPVIPMGANNSIGMDIIGPSVNMCCKINRHAAPNGVVIGGDLYSMVRKFDDYTFHNVKGFSLGFKHSYPVYRLARR